MNATIAGALAAFWFLIHPVAVYGVAYLVQRSILMATLFSVAMWLTFLEGIVSGKRSWLWLSVLCFYLAVFSKEHALLAPLVPFWLSVLHRRRIRSGIGWRDLLPFFILYAAIGIVVIVQSMRVIGVVYEPMVRYAAASSDWHARLLGVERVHWMSTLTQAGLFFKYLGLWLWPNPGAMSIDMREPVVASLDAVGDWLGLAAYLASGVVALALLWRGGRGGLAGLGLLIVLSLHAVELASVYLQEVFVLYRSYLWMTGMVVVLAVSLDGLAMRLRPAWLALPVVVALAALAGAAQMRLATFGSERLLWEDAVRLVEARTGPGTTAERAYFSRGAVYAREGDDERALADYGTALAQNPRYYLAYQARGRIQAKRGQFDQALQSFDQALEIRPEYESARLDKANVLTLMGRNDEALRELKASCQHGSMMGCYLHQRRTDPTAEFKFAPQQ